MQQPEKPGGAAWETGCCRNRKELHSAALDCVRCKRKVNPKQSTEGEAAKPILLTAFKWPGIKFVGSFLLFSTLVSLEEKKPNSSDELFQCKTATKFSNANNCFNSFLGQLCTSCIHIAAQSSQASCAPPWEAQTSQNSSGHGCVCKTIYRTHHSRAWITIPAPSNAQSS